MEIVLRKLEACLVELPRRGSDLVRALAPLGLASVRHWAALRNEGILSAAGPISTNTATADTGRVHAHSGDDDNGGRVGAGRLKIAASRC